MFSVLKKGIAVKTKISFDKTQGSRGELNHQLSRSPRRDLFLFPDDEMSSAVEDYFPAEDNSPDIHVGNPVQEKEEEKEEFDDSDDDFCILEHPDKEPEDLSHEVIIKSLIDEQVNIVENHFTVPVSSLITEKPLFLVASADTQRDSHAEGAVAVNATCYIGIYRNFLYYIHLTLHIGDVECQQRENDASSLENNSWQLLHIRAGEVSNSRKVLHTRRSGSMYDVLANTRNFKDALHSEAHLSLKTTLVSYH